MIRAIILFWYHNSIFDNADDCYWIWKKEAFFIVFVWCSTLLFTTRLRQQQYTNDNMLQDNSTIFYIIVGTYFLFMKLLLFIWKCRMTSQKQKQQLHYNLQFILCCLCIYLHTPILMMNYSLTMISTISIIPFLSTSYLSTTTTTSSIVAMIIKTILRIFMVYIISWLPCNVFYDSNSILLHYVTIPMHFLVALCCM